MKVSFSKCQRVRVVSSFEPHRQHAATWADGTKVKGGFIPISRPWNPGWGKPNQPHAGEDANYIRVTVRQIEDKDNQFPSSRVAARSSQARRR